ncbi:hypothetical protein PACTADRAFT_76458 [Pachysolen tannophilus NRRL Y-2460]|uniref:SURP motif domain-containing protein n=1 Tax=Pachysolen tannophilus NRRL Y-2460 TaxID=669874 RepID=A0A1E4TSY9_PACTA|nr:hypothetical protein PACTADRAFT_76458 [Pachysolen tannophilus NRRL Y-2460]
MSEEVVPEEIILPPGEIREIIDKTASYVFRNGPSFEIRVREKEFNNKKFSFLMQTDAYFSYYQWKLNQYKEGKVDNQKISEKVDGNNVVAADSNVVDSKDVIPEPDALEFCCDLLPMSSLDLDVIKMTAFFIAKNGSSFIDQVLRKTSDEASQFEFLNANHSFRKIFDSYVLQYEKILKPSEKLINKIEEGLKNPYNVLERAFQRAEYEVKNEVEKAAKEEQIAKKELEFASIDWQDFTIVETIEFDEADKVSELPLPLSLADLQYRSLAQKKANSLLEEAPPDFEENAENIIETIPPTQIEKDKNITINSTHTNNNGDIKEETQETSTPVTAANSISAPQKIARPVPRSMNIRTPGSSRRMRGTDNATSEATNAQEKMIRCPLTHKLIPESKFEQHIQIVLRDPRYKEEKSRFENKMRTTNLTTENVLENIRNIVNSTSRKRENEVDEKLNKVKKAKTVQWDGYKSSIGYVKEQAHSNIDIEDEKRKQKERREREQKIGPH